jgi:hypothetical protein
MKRVVSTSALAGLCFRRREPSKGWTAMRDEKTPAQADRSSAGGAAVLRLFNVATWREALAALEEEFDAVLGRASSTTDQELRRRHKG